MIGQVCTKPVVTVSPRATVQEAARLMRRKNGGALVVVGSSRPQGILTDRDIAMAVVAEGRDPAALSVSAVMRKNPAVIREDRGGFDAIKLLSAQGVPRRAAPRHPPAPRQGAEPPPHGAEALLDRGVEDHLPEIAVGDDAREAAA